MFWKFSKPFSQNIQPQRHKSVTAAMPHSLKLDKEETMKPYVKNNYRKKMWKYGSSGRAPGSKYQDLSSNPVTHTRTHTHTHAHAHTRTKRNPTSKYTAKRSESGIWERGVYTHAIAALFPIAKRGWQSQCSSVDEPWRYYANELYQSPSHKDYMIALIQGTK
jgi:hypothetical protein